MWSWVFYGLGGTVGCLIGGFVLSGTDPVTNAPTGNPYVCIFIQGCFSVLIALSGFLIDKKLEENLLPGFKRAMTSDHFQVNTDAAARPDTNLQTLISPEPMPLTSQRDARRKALRSQLARKGRQSTILTEHDDSLGVMG